MLPEVELEVESPYMEVVPIDNIPYLKLTAPDNTEILRFDPNGDIFLKGKLIENDKDVVEGFRELLRQQWNIN